MDKTPKNISAHGLNKLVRSVIDETSKHGLEVMIGTMIHDPETGEVFTNVSAGGKTTGTIARVGLCKWTHQVEGMIEDAGEKPKKFPEEPWK